MFITKCKVINKSQHNDNSYHIFYERYKKNITNFSHILSEDNIEKRFSRELNIGKEFFLLYSNESDSEPVAISFNGEFFYPAKTLDNGEPTRKQKRYLDIVNNNFKMTMFSFLDLSSYLSNDFNSIKYWAPNWFLSIIISSAIYGNQPYDNLSALIVAMLTMFILSVITTKARLWSNKLYLKKNKENIDRHQSKNLISHEQNAISLVDTLKNKNNKPTENEQKVIDDFLNKKLANNPTMIVQLQHEFYDKNLSSKKIYKILEKI